MRSPLARLVARPQAALSCPDLAMTIYLFVYGTLLPGNVPSQLASIVDQFRVTGAAWVSGRLYDFGNFPGAVLEPRSSSIIHGIAYEIPDHGVTLSTLDRYEGFDPRNPASSPFLRKQTRAMLEDGRTISAWIYEYKGDTNAGVLIPSGTYSKAGCPARRKHSG